LIPIIAKAASDENVKVQRHAIIAMINFVEHLSHE